MERIVISGAGDILIGRGIATGDRLLPDRGERRAVAVLAQPAVARLARTLGRDLGRQGLRVEVRVLPDGEAAKSLGVVGDVYAWLNEVGFTRHDTVVGVGGGALTDAAGFVAATYLRGVEAVYVPTTLLGAVDASVGGKTGINVDGKNLAGAFRHPARVVIDADVLDRLPEHLIRQGLAETVKAGLIGDAELVAILEEDGLDADLEEAVRRAVTVKAGVVGRDFREAGERAHLNYGHTVGHAVEVAAAMSHGEAIAVGMIAAGRVSALVADFTDEDRQRRVIERLGLPTRVEGMEVDEAHRLMALDKKRDASGLRFVVLRSIGDPSVVTVDRATLDAALSVVGITSGSTS